jgi:hypothetical protein
MQHKNYETKPRAACGETTKHQFLQHLAQATGKKTHHKSDENEPAAMICLSWQ